MKSWDTSACHNCDFKQVFCFVIHIGIYYYLLNFFLDIDTANMVDGSASADEVKVNIEEPRYDQSTYWGRAKHFSITTNPLNLFASSSALELSKEIVTKYRKVWCGHKFCDMILVLLFVIYFKITNNEYLIPTCMIYILPRWQANNFFSYGAQQ